MADKEKDGAPAKATPSTRTPVAWAKLKKTSPMILAAATVGKLWDREPLLEISESEFDAAIKWAEGVSAS